MILSPASPGVVGEGGPACAWHDTTECDFPQFAVRYSPRFRHVLPLPHKRARAIVAPGGAGDGKREQAFFESRVEQCRGPGPYRRLLPGAPRAKRERACANDHGEGSWQCETDSAGKPLHHRSSARHTRNADSFPATNRPPEQDCRKHGRGSSRRGARYVGKSWQTPHHSWTDHGYLLNRRRPVAESRLAT